MTTLNLEERIWIRNGQCHMAHQNSAREENYRGKTHVPLWKLKKGTYTHFFLQTWVFLRVEQIYSKFKTGAFGKLTMTSATPLGAVEAAFQGTSIYSTF